MKPILRGKDIERYKADWKKKWLIASHNGYDSISRINISVKSYPAIKRHLDSFGNKLKIRTDQGYTPYNLRNCAYYAMFDEEKIICSEIVTQPQFHLDINKKCICATCLLINGKKNKYLLALLNSKFCFVVFKLFYAGGGLGTKAVRYKIKYLNNLPLPMESNDNQYTVSEIENLVEQMIESKDQKRKNKIDKEIDMLIYKLYELSDEEINFIENY